ncbi:hypothetical protein F2Q70_00036198 [Brassica cretica]|uniref:Uncharacterized protein n=1 Tax=Brassica cretica TaxID=69181 RepID=A0A8S9JWY8_BRACR|nr:hypothetical protein F2Q70_00036198 [Brassica cretica]
MRRCPHGGDWSELAESLMEKPGRQDSSLHFWRLSGSMNRVEECMGQDPRILRGRILARLRIRGMRRFNKTRRPKMRILMLDYNSLAYASLACKSCNGLSFSCNFLPRLGIATRNSRMVLCRAFLEDPGHVFPESEDLEIHPSETHDSWVRFFINRRLCGLSSRNPEAGWTFVLEPRGWMDSRPGTRKAGWSLVMEPGGCRVNPFFRPGGRPLSMSFFRCCILPFILRSYLDLEIMWEPGGSPFDPEIVSGPGGHVGTKRLLWTQRSFGNPEVPLALEVVLNPGLYKNLEVYLFQALRCFHDPETAWGPKGTVLRLPRKSLTGLEGAGVGVMTQVLGFAAFHVWRRRDLVIPFIDLEAWMDARVGAGASLNRNLEAGVRNLALAAVELMSSGHGRRGPLSLGKINHSAWMPEAGTQTRGKGPRPRGRDPDPGAGTRNLEAGTQKLETSARILGHQTPLSIVLGCTCGRSERIHSLVGDILPGEWAIILDSIQTRGLDQVVYSSVNPVGMVSRPGRICTLDSDGLEVNNQEEPPYSYVAPVAILGLSSGRTSACISGVSLVFVPVSLLRLAYLMLLEATSNARMALCRAFLEDLGHVFSESEDLEIHPSETHGSWVRFFINRRSYGLSSRNLETGWTFVLEPGGWMDSRPGTWRL